MRVVIILVSLFFACSVAYSQEKSIHEPDATKQTQRVKAGCGKCLYYMRADDCLLAVRTKGKTYEVQGTSISDHGDEHAKEGLCSAVRKADVQGEVRNGKFVATYFKLVDNKKKKRNN